MKIICKWRFYDNEEAFHKSQMDMLGSASLVHAGLTDLSGLEGLGDHLSHHHHAAVAAGQHAGLSRAAKRAGL